MPKSMKELMEEVRAAMPANDPHRNDVPGSPWFREFISKEATSVANFSEAECRTLCKKAGVEYQNGYEGRIVQFKYTDGTVDRYGDKILAKGVKLDKYKTNPIILGFHDSHTFPIGASLKVWYEKSDDSIKGWVLFLDDRVDKSGFADSMFRMVKAGIVKTGSIGFIPTKFRRPDEEERTKLGIGEYGYLFEEIELLEFSIVPLPANPSAMMEPITKGLISQRAFNTITSEKLYTEEEMIGIRKAWDDTHRSPIIVRADSESPAVVSATPITLTDPNPGTSQLPDSKEFGKITFNVTGTEKNIESTMGFIKEYQKDHDVTVNVTLVEKSQGTELQDICALMRDIKTKTLLTKEQKNVIQDCMQHVTALMECLQELLDASSTEDEEGEGEGKTVPVTPQVPPVGENANKDLYNPDFLRKIEETTKSIENLGKGK